MQLTFLTSLVLAGAALTQASVLNHQRSYLHYSYKRGENSTFNDTGIANGAASPSLGTAVLPDTFTTLTVVATEVVTITSCAPTITSCPAAATDLASLPPEAVQTVLVTNTVVLTEVVCPVTLADAISSRVIEKHRTGGVSVVRTLPPGPVETGVVNGGVVVVTVTKVKTITTEKVLTLTLVEVGGFLGGAIGGQRGQLLITTTTETVLQTELEVGFPDAHVIPFSLPSVC